MQDESTSQLQTRIAVVAGLLGAAAGLIVLLYLLLRPAPEPDLKKVQATPEVTNTPPPSIPAAHREEGTLKGLVENGLTGEPIDGATVIALHPHLQSRPGEVPRWGDLIEQGRTRTGKDGTFEIGALPPDYWNLWVQKMGYAFTSVPRVKFHKKHVIKLYPACTIHGRIVYPDGSPAPGVRIEYTPQGTQSEVFSHYHIDYYKQKTDDQGRFRYTELPPGKFTVEVYPANYLPAPWTMEPPLKPGEDRDLGTKRLDSGFGMKVHVLAYGTNKPIAGMEVKVLPIGDPMPRTQTGQTRRTDENGLAVFQGLGGQVIGHPKFLVTANVPGKGPVTPDGRQMFSPNEDVVIHIRQMGIVTGKAIGPGGEPLSRFSVDLVPLDHHGGPRPQWCDKGSFEVYQVPEGKYRLNVRSQVYEDGSIPEIVAVAGKKTDVGTVQLRSGATIYGVVRRPDGSTPQKTVRVDLARLLKEHPKTWETVRWTVCKTDGSFRIPGVPSESNLFLQPTLVTDISRTTEPVPVTVPEGGTVRVDLVLYGEGFLKLYFTDERRGAIVPVAPPSRGAFLLEKATGREIRWFGDGTPLRPGSYDLYVALDTGDGTTKRFLGKAGIEVQEGKTVGPIRVPLQEIRNAGQGTSASQQGAAGGPGGSTGR